MSDSATSSLSSNLDYTSKDATVAIIIIGASGDLARRKTFPSIFSLYERGFLPNSLVIYGYGRSDIQRESLHSKILPFINTHQTNESSQKVKDFLKLCYYHRGSGYNDNDAFCKMRESIESKAQNPKSIHYLFYMAIPPNLFATATQSVRTMMKSIPSNQHRCLFEKPFGSDIDSYNQLSTSLSKLLTEQQIYRIDHYLGKDVIRFIPSFRFDNTLISNIWSNENVSRVIISVKETIGLEGRGGYFDEYGIIRDVIQNHLIQIMCLIAMEKPKTNSSCKAEAIRDAKCQVLRDTKKPTLKDCIVGQYDGYLCEELVRTESRTPTYCLLKLTIDNERWQGVPFYLVAGKCLNEKLAEVDIQLKEPRLSFNTQKGLHDDEYYSMKMKIQPEKYVSLGNRNAGTTLKLFEKTRDDAYANLIHDALQGNSSSFVRDDELKLSWKLLTPLLHELESIRPLSYKQGSEGPREVQSYLHNNHNKDMTPKL